MMAYALSVDLRDAAEQRLSFRNIGQGTTYINANLRQLDLQLSVRLPRWNITQDALTCSSSVKLMGMEASWAMIAALYKGAHARAQDFRKTQVMWEGAWSLAKTE